VANVIDSSSSPSTSSTTMTYRDRGVFRAEAVRHADRRGQEGRPLRLTRAWVEHSFWLLAALAVIGLWFCALADVGEHAQGPALVRVEGRTTVTATTAGVIAEIEVEPGAAVHAGDVLVRIHDATERAELEGLELELETELGKLLLDPNDQAVRAKLAGLVGRRDLARVRLAQREVRAPHDGTVSDARTRPGQAVAPGEPLLTVERPDGEAVVVAMLPGEYRPLLRAGMSAQLELFGFRHELVEVPIHEIGDEVIGAAEVARFLGQERADAVAVNGGVVLVCARLPSRAFEIDGRTYRYFDGMQGHAKVRVRAQSILTTLVPGLRALAD
jgi:multidrug resistance efflux pump